MNCLSCSDIKDENDLIEKAKCGDAAAFEKLLSYHQEKIYNFAYRLTGNEPDARDISQDAMIKAYLSLKDFRQNSSFSTWLWRIVYNTFLDLCKSSYSKNALLSIPLETALFLKDNNPGPDKEMENSDFRKQVEDTLSKLPLKNRAAIIMCDIQGFSYEDIAEISKISVGTVKSRLNRGRKLLQKLILKSGTFS